MRISCNTDNKHVNRELIKGFIERKFSKKYLKNAHILSLPGGHSLELNMWKEMGVMLKNIDAFTNEIEDYNYLKKYRNLNVYKFDLFKDSKLKEFDTDMEQYKHELYTMAAKLGIRNYNIIYLDLYNNIDWILPCFNLLSRIKNGGIFGLTFSIRRERVLKNIRELYINKYNKFDAIVLFFTTLLINFPILFNMASNKLPFRKVIRNIFTPSDNKLISLNHPNISKRDKYGLLKKGYYPTSIFKSKYIGDNKTPMMTILAKIRRISNLTPINFERIIYKKIEELFKQESYLIGESSKDKIVKEHNGINIYVNKKKKKRQIIKFIKTFPDIEDAKAIQEIFNITPGQYRAFKAHITMGTYSKN